MKTLEEKKDAVPKRWLQFSLRSLLVLMLLVAAFCGGWVSHARWTRVKTEEAIQQALLDSIHESFRAAGAASGNSGEESDLEILSARGGQATR